MAALLCLPLQANAADDTASSAWPDKVVPFEQMEATTRPRFRLRGNVGKGKVTGPTVVRVHVDAAGAVVRTMLLASCGNPDLDEAVLHGMRDMLFKPYMDEGTPVPVTLVAPIHVPRRLGRSD